MMNCPTCGYKMADTELDCPRCIKFSLATAPISQEANTDRQSLEAENLAGTVPIPGLQGSAVEESSETDKIHLAEPTAFQTHQRQLGRRVTFKPTWFDYMMQVLTVIVVISEHGLTKLVGCFYVLLAFAYVLDWSIKGMKKLGSRARN